MRNLFFNPIVPTINMIIYSVVLIIIVIINRKHIWNRLLIIILFFIITQRPMIKDVNNLLYTNLDILFVVDTTVSMNAVDIDESTRLLKVKKDCLAIMDYFRGANFALITFNNYSAVKTPFTSDLVLLNDLIDDMDIIDPNYAVGSSLDMPYENMKNLLESSKNREDHKQIVFFISDGELTLKNKNNSDSDKYAELRELIDDGAVLGYGSTNGGKIKIEHSIDSSKVVDEDGFLLDKTKKIEEAAISKMNEQNLLYLKDKLSLDYYHMTKFSVLEKKLNKIKDNTVKSTGDDSYLDEDLYYYFSIPLLILLIYELFYYRRNEE